MIYKWYEEEDDEIIGEVESDSIEEASKKAMWSWMGDVGFEPSYECVLILIDDSGVEFRFDAHVEYSVSLFEVTCID